MIFLQLAVKLFTREKLKELTLELDPNLYSRKPTGILKYIDIATHAMINDGKKADDIKAMLKNRGMYEDHFDIVLDHAQRNYKKWFNKTGGKSASTASHLYGQSFQNAVTSSVELVTYKGENHALHFSILISYQRYFLITGRNLLYTVADEALSNPPVLSDRSTAIRQSTFAKQGGNISNPYLRVVTINDNREAIYPYLRTEIKTSFLPQQIIEWDNGDPIVEAEVDGSLNRTTPVCFFATDYAVNKKTYQCQNDIEIRLSALILELFEADKNTNEISQQPKGFWTNDKYKSKSYFSFEAVILEIKEANVDRLTIGCVKTIKLDRDERAKSDFVIDAYITETNNNIKADQIHKDMLVNGILWFQGEIAD
jgi:hypothetical protein